MRKLSVLSFSLASPAVAALAFVSGCGGEAFSAEGSEVETATNPDDLGLDDPGSEELGSDEMAAPSPIEMVVEAPDEPEPAGVEEVLPEGPAVPDLPPEVEPGQGEMLPPVDEPPTEPTTPAEPAETPDPGEDPQGNPSSGTSSPGTDWCDNEDLIVCDDFESDIENYELQGEVALSDEQPYDGLGSLKATTASSGDKAAIRAEFDAVESGTLYARAHYFVPAQVNVRRLDLLSLQDSCTIVATAFGTSLFCAADEAFAQGWVPIPQGRWFCLQWEHEVDDWATTSVFIDGELAISVEGIDTRADGHLDAVRFPVTHSGDLQPSVEIYVDNFALSTSPLECE